MSVQAQSDAQLLEEMLAPPPLDEARSSLEYWKRRGQILPVYRRAARREAKEMATRWQERVDAAEQARFEASVLGQLLAALGLSGLWIREARSGGHLIARTVKLVLGVLAAAWLIVALAAAAAIVMVALQLT